MPNMRGRYVTYAWGVLGFNLLVILWGALVRATGSGAGCGSHWPLCNGEVVPRSPEVATLIEFGHRATSGIALLLVVGLAIGAWRGFERGHPVRRTAALALALMVAEALIGAGLVLLELVAENVSVARGFWAAGHLTNTFLLVGALAMTAWVAETGSRISLRSRGSLPLTLGLALLGVLLLGMTGAVTALGDTLFPASSAAEARAQAAAGGAHLFVRLRVWHPALAFTVALVVLLAALHASAARPSVAVRKLAIVLSGLYVTQLIVGIANVWLLAPVGMQIVHLFLSDLVWIALVLLAATALAGEETSAAHGVLVAGDTVPSRRIADHRASTAG